MLRELRLTNFKCFDGATIGFAPLTLLCGGNGAGKSSVVQALLVLRQSFASGDLQAGRLILGGALTDLGAGRDVLYEDAADDVVAFELHARGASWSQSFEYLRSADRLQARTTTPHSTSPEVEHDELVDVQELQEAMQAAKHWRQWKKVPPLGGRLNYVSADRLGPRKFHPHSEVSARLGDLGALGEYALNYLQARGDDALPANDPRCTGLKSRRLLDIVDHWLQEITPGARLEMEKIQDADAIVAGFSFDRPDDVRTRRHRATNVGFGLSYTLPVLTALATPPGTLCVIENPEAHLHPRGQTRLAEFAARAALAGVQVIAETHSDHFMDGVRIAVRDGLLQPDQVAFHYFDRTSGKTEITSPEVDADGRLSSWPAGFFDQHEENLARLLAPKA